MNDLQKEVLEQLGTQFTFALEGMLGEQWVSSLQDRELPTDGSQYLCWGQKVNHHAVAVIQVAAGIAEWREVGRRALQAAGLEEPEESDIRATYLELLTQALSGLARFLTEKAGAEVNLASGSEVPLPAPGGGTLGHCLCLTSPTGFAAELFVYVEPAAMEALLRNGAREESAGAARADRARADSPAGRAEGGNDGPANRAPGSSMDLLLDVEMPVSISFGRTHLALRDVVKLSTGSIIELNRTISEPVEVIVNNCVVARGEVVVVEGNYGVRIQQIISRSERLRSVD